jgi:transposase
MPAKDHLTLKQQRKLQEALKREENAEIRERIFILLLLNDGKTQQEIAKFIGCSKNKVNYWCVHGDSDNLESASFHKKQEYLEKIETEMPQIYLEYLPEYSPDYNLIELVWHSAKEYIAGRLFKSIEELEFLLHKLLNEGELIIKWGRKLKNKGNALITV